MIKVEKHYGKPVICKGISSDPMREGWMLLQMPDETIQELFHLNIKHISSYENSAN